MFFRTRTIFLAQFLLTGLLSFGMPGALSASESEVLKVSKILTHQVEVDRVLSISITSEVSTLDQDDFFVFNSKTVGKTKSYRADSIGKEVSFFEMHGITINFQSLHSNFQSFDLKFENTLSVVRDFSTQTQMSILTKADSNSILSLEDFEKLKLGNVSISDRSSEIAISYRIRNFLILSLFQDLICPEVSLELIENNICPSQQIKLVRNLTKKTSLQINQFNRNRKGFLVRSFPNLVRVPTFLSISPRLEKLMFQHQKEKANQVYSPIFLFVIRTVKWPYLPFVSVDRDFELLTLGIHTSLKTIEVERGVIFQKRISFKTPTNEGMVEIKERAA
ncbi:hypothetical protein [Leptospira mayottensis]|uniref:hypothetical protein n=1 Tax=Leptospira mayottensis TaxID=1137606 RepID=UPI0002BFA3E3|nr:hypothetical protein [Leptospira mayottensis]AXR62766.1 hypothetical protein DQM68_19090 [Leptospira mayottensis]AZQ04152.1 hypothetical protein LEP1GSC190_19165 [Leptospira mayottensis 200901116]TGN06749.1 hypothetical protein EHR03_09800 [Leptospira mayottensis]